MMDGELDRDQARTYRYREADQYTLIDDMRRIPFSEYTPDDDYGKRAFDTAFEMKELGALMTVFVTQDVLLRCLVETSEKEDEFMKRQLKTQYMFLDENPAAVREWFYADGFDAVGLDNLRYGKTKTECGTRLLCARLDPAKFECSICDTGEDRFCGMNLGIELRYKPDTRWSLFGYVPHNLELPYGRYVLATNVRTTPWPCVCGSRVTVSNHMLSISASVATLQDINRQKTPA